jgi:formate dehydrogenase subunit beta
MADMKTNALNNPKDDTITMNNTNTLESPLRTRQDYDKITIKLKDEIKGLLNDPGVKHVITWTAGSYGLRIAPIFLDNISDLDKVIWSPFCINSLAVYPTLEEKLPLPRGTEEDKRKIVITVKGCDSRGLLQMFAEMGYPRERVIILGIPCTGQIEPEKLLTILNSKGVDNNISINDLKITDLNDKFKIQLNEKQLNEKNEKSYFELILPKLEIMHDKCSTCRYPNPLIFDKLLSEPVQPRGMAGEGYGKVKELEAMNDSERWSYWAEKFDRCIRCYACRNICPVCYCKECLTDKWEPDWINKSVNLTENTMFHIMRAFHMAGRCISCHECERACPVGIPLLDIYKKLEKEILELWSFEPGKTLEADKSKAILSTFNPDDPGEFIM